MDDQGPKNEQDWLACTDPDAMSVFLHYHYKEQNDADADRKLGLMACACARRIWHLLTDERSRRAIEIIERHLNECVDLSSLGELSESELGQAHRAALEAWGKMAEVADAGDYGSPLLRAMPDAGLAAYQAVDGDLQCLGNASSAAASYAAPCDTPEWLGAKKTEQRAQVEIIRQFFPNPFQTQPS
jgi:hypothetical protein